MMHKLSRAHEQSNSMHNNHGIYNIMGDMKAKLNTAEVAYYCGSSVCSTVGPKLEQSGHPQGLESS